MIIIHLTHDQYSCYSCNKNSIVFHALILHISTGIYAITDLYGRCVELAVYDEDFAIRSPRAAPSTQGQSTAASATTTVTVENDLDQCKLK